MTNKRIKEPYSLSKLNGILLLVLCCAYPLYFVVLKNNYSPHNIGISIGSVIGTLIVPVFFSFIGWFVSGKRAHVGHITLNIFVGLMFFSLFGQIGTDQAKMRSDSVDLTNAMEEYRSELRNNNGTADSSYKKITGTVRSELDKLIRNSRGKERESYQVLREYFTLSDSIMSGWQDAYGETATEGMLDFSVLTTDSACIAQKNTYRRFVNRSIDYKRFVNNRVDFARRKVDSLGYESKFTKMMLSKIEKTNEVQGPILNKYLAAYIDHTKRTINLIDMMQSNMDDWYFEGDEFYIDDDRLLIQFNSSVDTMAVIEEEINELSLALIETI